MCLSNVVTEVQPTFEILLEKVGSARVRGTLIACISVVAETQHAADASAVSTAVRFTLHTDVDVVNRP